MTAITEDRAIFENEEWLVTGGGLEHKTTGYFIDRASVAQRRDDGLWAWPLHMAEKSWCALPTFAEAFACAAAEYGIDTGADLARTFKLARRDIAAWPQAAIRALPPGPKVFDALQNGDGTPISLLRGKREKPFKNADFRNLDSAADLPVQQVARPFSVTQRSRLSRLSMARAAALHWRAPRRLRRTGSKLVRLIQSAWSIR